MPVYRLMCDECGHEEDAFRRIAEIDHNLPTCCASIMRRKVCAPTVIADIAPYQAMGVDVATGKAPIISSRSEHRAYLKRNGYVELGNDAPTSLPKKLQGDFNLRRELTEAVREVVPKYTV